MRGPIFPDAEFVAVDLETTGGDAGRDRIIEVGAVLFRDGEAIDTFDTLVNPGRPLPPFIVRLTGIDDAMLADAPPVEEAIRAFARFAGDRLLVAHNAAFEEAFLAPFGFAGRFLDSLFLHELAAPLSRHNLESAAQALGVGGERHRALPDALAAGHVFLSALQAIEGGRPELLAELGRLATGAGAPDLALLAARLSPSDASWRRPARPAAPRGRRPPPPPPLPDIVAARGLEPRSGQLQLEAAVVEALRTEGVLVAEAGTGVGKSLAYLVGGLRVALAEGRRLVVSTYTRTLQDQVLGKDVVELADLLPGLSATSLKGQANYLCLLRFEAERAEAAARGTDAERKGLMRLLAWAEATGTGERGELNVPSDLWARVEVRRERCTREACPFFTDCFYFQARRAAEEADTIVVNHALLLQEARAEASLLDDAYLVVDEAHELERAATDALTERAAEEEILRLVGEARGYGSAAAAAAADVSAALDRFRQAVLATGRRWLTDEFLASLEGERLAAAAQDLGVSLLGLAQAVLGDETRPEEERKALAELIRRPVGVLLSTRPEVDREEAVLYTEIDERAGRVRLSLAPLTPAQFLRDVLWPKPRAAVLTSATLAVAGSFGHVLELLGLDGDERTTTAVFPSPFHYRDQALLFAVEDLPDPQDESAFLAAAATAVVELVAAAQGRTLVLFTAHRHLRAVAEAARPRLRERGVEVLAQGLDGSRARLLEALRRGRGRVAVFGAQSFWEGVDVAGPSLSLVVITKLPFQPPDDPVLEARMARLARMGRAPFRDLLLPAAVQRFKQGFGRLIRRGEDVGAVVVLDRRLVHSRYGEVFLASLPGPEVRRGGWAEAVEAVRSFLEVEA